MDLKAAHKRFQEADAKEARFHHACNALIENGFEITDKMHDKYFELMEAQNKAYKAYDRLRKASFARKVA